MVRRSLNAAPLGTDTKLPMVVSRIRRMFAKIDVLMKRQRSRSRKVSIIIIIIYYYQITVSWFCKLSQYKISLQEFMGI